MCWTVQRQKPVHQVIGDMSAVPLHGARNVVGHMPSGHRSTNVLVNQGVTVPVIYDHAASLLMFLLTDVGY